MNELKKSVTKLRLIQFAMIAGVSMFGWVAEMAHHPGSNSWTFRDWVVAAFALSIVFTGSNFRTRMLARATTLLAKDTSDPRALKQWEAAQIIGMAFAENIALWGCLYAWSLGVRFGKHPFFIW